MEKRTPKPRKVFSPDPYVRVPKAIKKGGKIDGRKKEGRDKRQRNVVADEGSHNKWSVYQHRLQRLLSVLRTQSHFLDVMTQQKRERTAASSSNDRNDSEVNGCVQKIGAAKCSIISLFQEIAGENKDDRVFPQLAADADESGLIDVDEVVCSLCGTDDVIGNDVLLCDRTGCCRAYHQKCLSPAVIISDDNDPDADWFCWQCECIDDCLDLVNEQCETEISAWEDLFPELREQQESSFGNALSEDSDDDEEDDDYNPDADRMESNNDYSSDAGYDTDELSYDGIEPVIEELLDADGNKISSTKDENGDDGEESDLEGGIDSNEIGQLLDEAGQPAVSDSITVAGRTMRPRTVKEARIDPLFTVEGTADVGKNVLKVKRGVVILGEITAYYVHRTSVPDVIEVDIDTYNASLVASAESISTPDTVPKSSSSSDALGSSVGAFGAQIDQLITTSTVLEIRSTTPTVDVACDVEVEVEVRVLPEIVSEVVVGNVTQENLSTPSSGQIKTVEKASEKEGQKRSERITGVAVDLDSCEGLAEVESGAVAAHTESEQVKLGDESVSVSGAWHVVYHDGSEVLLNEIELRESFHAYKEHLKQLSKAKRAAHSIETEDMIRSKGCLDVSNVLEHKRNRKQIDYASLSLQMFGTVVDDDPEADDLVNENSDHLDWEEIEDNQTKKKRKYKKKDENPMRKSASPPKNNGDDVPFVLDHILFQIKPHD